MADKLSPPPGGSTVLVFGCQCLCFDANDFRRLRSVVLDSPDDFSWVLDTLAELPVYMRTAATRYIPSLQSIPGEQQLRDLHEWFRTGIVEDEYFPLPYTQLAPLFTILQFTQYAQYLRLTHPAYAKTGVIPTRDSPVVEIAGFCIGFLNAAVVSAATTRDELRKYAAVAVRLAMFLGAIGDAQESQQKFTSLAVVWKEPGLLEREIDAVLEKHPDAYITVRYDANRATLMAPRDALPQLQKDLQAAGLNGGQVEFNGRYHWRGHSDTVAKLLEMCATDPALQLPDASHLARSIRENITGEEVYAKEGALHELVLHSILAKQCQWETVFSNVYNSQLASSESIVIEFGTEKCVPPTFMRSLKTRIVHFADLDIDLTSRLSPLKSSPRIYEDDIAVVGMACRVAGADDLEEFWKLLCSGESQHQEMPASRYENYETPWRPEAIRGWFGNFVRDIDAFDHKFFKKVPREVMSQDPQQRLLLQVAYQALEQSGYFHKPNIDKNIACYVTCCTVDYEHNVNCHASTAYSATGLLRSFMAGKLSHYFGWRGPALCVDTACSGSTVALHHACKSILSGECSAALVGGSNILTSPLAFDNLNGASFVSPTGPCKPFDAKADGYCRGEGVAAIFVKRLSAAIADGDTILGTIAATAVEQNNNCTPVVVPDAPSLAGLFTKVTSRAHIRPRDISVVEAHGTGTQAGDPAEYRSIRDVLGGPQRKSTLALGSVKGLVGHTEGVSGLVALIKVLLMIHKGKIPPQPNFHTMNPYIPTAPDDNIEISKEFRQWDAKYRAVLINNYGACGSNASLVVTEAPKPDVDGGASMPEGAPLPFRLCALDEGRIREYAQSLRQFLRQNASSEGGDVLSLANLSFNLSRQSNPGLDRQWIFACRSVAELENKLTAVIDGDTSQMVKLKKPVRPVVFCFGGQVSTFIGLDKAVYDAFALLRHHLDKIDEILQSKNYPSLYPGIFERTPITDQVELQTKLFALQYACAQAWIDSGISVAAVVGHSFGELTAMCVSGMLSLPDAVVLVARRATLIRDTWGEDRGAMLAVEADRAQIDQLLRAVDSSVAIACVNGPRSFTLAGTTADIDATQEVLKKPDFQNLRTKRLSVTNAFHSVLVEPLIPSLKEVTQGLTLREPTIHLERATEDPSTGLPSSTVIADHLRQPVYFNNALQRLAAKHASCIWLEAGSNSTITVMASRALAASSAEHHFQAVNITGDAGVQSVTDTTLALWKEGIIPVTFWAHHTSQKAQYSPLFLPPYQFEKSRHWLDNKKLPAPTTSVSLEKPETASSSVLSFLRFQDSKERVAKFRVNTSHPEFFDAMSGHVAARTAPLAPASLMLDNVVEALRSLPVNEGKVPQVHNVASEAPLCPDAARDVWIELHAQDADKTTWDLKYLSEDRVKGSKTRVLHCSARFVMYAPDDPRLQSEFARYSRLVNHSRCRALLDNPDVDDILQGRNVYRTFSEVVEYSDIYKGVQKLVGKGTESAGRVVKKYTGHTWADPFLCDSFSQCAGFWVNCMTDRSPSDIYIASGMELWMRTPRFADPAMARPETWEVIATHQRAENHYTSDIFVFDPANGELVEMFIGMQYAKVAKTTFSKLLSMFAPGYGMPKSETPVKAQAQAQQNGPTTEKKSKTSSKPEKKRKTKKAASNLVDRVKGVVAEFCAVDPSEISEENSMADSGVDSLMAMELAKELEEAFHCTLPATDLMEADTFRDLVNCVRNAVGEEAGDEDEADEEEEPTSDDSDVESGASDADEGTPRCGSITSVSDYVPELHIPQKAALEAFGEIKALTDEFLAENHCSGRVHTFTPIQFQLCVTLTLEAFEELGSPIRTAKPGQRLERIPFDSQHEELVTYLYRRLEEARIIDLDGPTAVRTAVSAPSKSSTAMMDEISRTWPEFAGASRLAHYTGSRLASVLRGEQDGIQLIFGTKEGQERVSWMYGDEPHNVTGYKQMLNFIERLVQKLDPSTTQGPLRILEMGAGTGGGTKWFLPGLAKLEIPIEYTFTDISPAFLAQARRKFKEYPFVQYKVHDIEKQPAEELIGTQHIIIASNAVHATSSLVDSTRFMRQALRPDGVVMMMEMTRPVFAIDIVFGLFRGWWVFSDGRNHAITGEERWETDLHKAGYGHVDWTDGYSSEVKIQRVIFATATGSQGERLPLGKKPETASNPLAAVDNEERRRVTDEYIKRSVDGFEGPSSSEQGAQRPGSVVLVTGATGSLGSHLVAHLARLSSVQRVVCLNRPNSKQAALQRQRQAFTSRGITVSTDEMSKLLVLETNLSDPRLGLSAEQYATLVDSVTDIVHNGWPMNGARALSSFEAQFQTMRNLVDLARDIASTRPAKSTVGFQLISSIGVVGLHPLITGQPVVPEERTTSDSILGNGYGEAKYICEKILDKTLHQHPDRFRTMVVRPGQIAGSSQSGSWNSAEHLPALIKSAQTLRALPAFEGPVSWTPVDKVAATLSDLLFTPKPYAVYHVDNPVRQPWSDVLAVLAQELSIPSANIVPFAEWIQRMKDFPGSWEDNPAVLLGDMLGDNFERMSCGGLLLDTTRAREHSRTLAGVGPVGQSVVKMYVDEWKSKGFLH